MRSMLSRNSTDLREKMDYKQSTSMEHSYAQGWIFWSLWHTLAPWLKGRKIACVVVWNSDNLLVYMGKSHFPRNTRLSVKLVKHCLTITKFSQWVALLLFTEMFSDFRLSIWSTVLEVPFGTCNYLMYR